MTIVTQHCFRTLRGTLISALRIGFRLALAYSLLFALYAIVRSSFQIGAILSPADGLFGTLLANAFAIMLPSMLMGLLLGIVAALLMALTWLGVYGFSAWLNPARLPGRAFWIGALASGAVVVVLQVMMQRSLGIYFAALWPAGYFFWLGLPCLLFVAATTWVSWQASDPMGIVPSPAMPPYPAIENMRRS